ncbi:hypothetical protein GCL60_16615 [Silvanigrella paludirubra]|uniref:Uncharacterized protein n=1 Tax=Silvanigrella paludirubra TaxID=2499159 RepID=A0A6N6VPB6_9BACT|nr:hypothetical protein [Silvanigrella paludirubra]KAB8035852.1 hypothetical protein GCL60_16615 [Silvanigrella paludirubra]
MAEERPEELPEWGTKIESLIKAPSLEKRKLGYSIDPTTGLADIPSLKGENWFRNLVYKWIKYFDEKISNLNISINSLSISDKEKQIDLNKWHDLISFVLPKGKWIFIISFKHSIARDQQLNNLEQSPIFVCGISKTSGPLSEINSGNNIEIVKRILSLSEVGNTLYSSYLAKEYEQGHLGSAVENIGFSCIIDNQIDTTYYVKDLCFSYPNGLDVFKIFYQINAIKIG